MKHPHIAYRHSSGHIYACDIHASDGRKVASVAIDPPIDGRGEDIDAMGIAQRLLECAETLRGERQMAHHGDDPDAAFPEAFKSLLALSMEERLVALRERQADPNIQQEFGATGKFPQGKLNSDDEGELQFGVAHTDGKVVIKFGKPIAWLEMDATQAEKLAALLITHANATRQRS